MNKQEFAEARMWRTSCSALVRGIYSFDSLLDVAVGHNTWTDFGSMVRAYKLFNFQLSTAAVKKISFSSKPGLMYSKDDFYVLDNQMVVLETTNGIMDNKLYQLIDTASLLTWQRLPTVNRMSRSGDEWTGLVSKYNSGTYTNQWIVIDYKRLTPGEDVQPGLLWVAEQIPGMTQRADVTQVFSDQGFWASYNVPYFAEIYNMSGFPAYRTKFGDDYSYDKCPRAQIFGRDAPTKVNEFKDMRWMMQYNDYQNDPFSRGDPGNAVASRYDLRASPTAPAFGAIDAKITSSADVAAMRSYATSGPTQQGQPAFTWTAQWNATHLGEPTTFNFVWQVMSFV
jgi:hypothetical protein